MYNDPNSPQSPPQNIPQQVPYGYNDMQNFGYNPQYGGDLTNLNPQNTAYNSPMPITTPSYDPLLQGGPVSVNDPNFFAPTTAQPTIDPMIEENIRRQQQTQQAAVTTTTISTVTTNEPVVHSHITTTPEPYSPPVKVPSDTPAYCGVAAIVCGVIAIIGLVTFIIWFPIWLGVFFGLSYPEIQIKQNWVVSTCQVTSNNIGQANCCSNSCGTCTNCAYNQNTCQSYNSFNVPQNTTVGCCNGYYCCRTCCSTCTSCSYSGRSRSCYTYSCNCYCCQSVSNQLCNYQCKTCWKPVINVNVNVKATSSDPTNSTTASSMNTDCGSNYGCVNNYLNQYPVNSTFTCIYNPGNPTQYEVGDGSYNKQYFDTMYAFAGLSISSLVCLCGGLVLAAIAGVAAFVM